MDGGLLLTPGPCLVPWPGGHSQSMVHVVPRGLLPATQGHICLLPMCETSLCVTGCVANAARCRKPGVARAFHIPHSEVISSHSPLLSAPGSGLQSASKYKSLRPALPLIPLKPAKVQPLQGLFGFTGEKGREAGETGSKDTQ